jgi:hypothetical protein
MLSKGVARPLRRAFALIAAAWLVLGFALAAHHEATEAHVLDARGDAVHASRLVGAHHGDHTDVHAVDSGGEGTEPCGIVGALHQPISARVAAPPTTRVAAVAPAVVAIVAGARAPVTVPVYRLAPKTSPPRA